MRAFRAGVGVTAVAAVLALGAHGRWRAAPGAARLIGGETGPVGPAPGGQDAVGRLVLPALFSPVLLAARAASAGAPLWAVVGARLALPTVNRVMLGATGAAPVGP
ncbi:hypothetical protein [Streptomyces termitum]|uniref:hypothetical protein n=1 Tax=Streptomyces termitum TaxID=67368 RepID=UPI0037889769